MKSIIFVMGGSGSGKSTLVRSLTDFDELKTIHLGELCRKHFEESEIAKADNPAAPELTEQFVRDAVLKVVNEPKADYKVIVIDGMPRSTEQVGWIKENLSEHTIDFVWVSASLPTVVKRLRTRDKGKISDLSMSRLHKESGYLVESIQEILKNGWDIDTVENDGNVGTEAVEKLWEICRWRILTTT